MTDKFINKFVKQLELENLADKTIDKYTDIVQNFIKWHGEFTSVSQIDEASVNEYLEERFTSHASATVNQAIAAIRKFVILLDGRRLQLKRAKIAKKLPKALSANEMQGILEASKADVEDAAILHLLYSSGLRISEICRLNITDLDMGERIILVRDGKGGKDRIVLFDSETKRYIMEYLATRKDKNPALFLSSRRERVSHSYVTRRVKYYAKKAGVDASKVSPHVFRHTFATHLLDKGVDLQVIQELLGHEDINTTTIYTKLVNKKMIDAYNKAW